MTTDSEFNTIRARLNRFDEQQTRKSGEIIPPTTSASNIEDDE